MGVIELAVAVIEQANEDLVLSKDEFELEKNYYFFRNEAFVYWCDMAEVRENTRKIIIKSVEQKRNKIRRLFELTAGDERLRYSESVLMVMNFHCVKRALLKLEEVDDLLLKAKPVNGKGWVGLKFEF